MWAFSRGKVLGVEGRVWWDGLEWCYAQWSGVSGWHVGIAKVVVGVVTPSCCRCIDVSACVCAILSDRPHGLVFFVALEVYQVQGIYQ